MKKQTLSNAVLQHLNTLSPPYYLLFFLVVPQITSSTYSSTVLPHSTEAVTTSSGLQPTTPEPTGKQKVTLYTHITTQNALESPFCVLLPNVALAINAFYSAKFELFKITCLFVTELWYLNTNNYRSLSGCVFSLQWRHRIPPRPTAALCFQHPHKQ